MSINALLQAALQTADTEKPAILQPTDTSQNKREQAKLGLAKPEKKEERAQVDEPIQSREPAKELSKEDAKRGEAISPAY